MEFDGTCEGSDGGIGPKYTDTAMLDWLLNKLRRGAGFDGPCKCSIEFTVKKWMLAGQREWVCKAIDEEKENGTD